MEALHFIFSFLYLWSLVRYDVTKLHCKSTFWLSDYESKVAVPISVPAVRLAKMIKSLSIFLQQMTCGNILLAWSQTNILRNNNAPQYSTEMKHLHCAPQPPLTDCLQMHTTWLQKGKPAEITNSTGRTKKDDTVRLQIKGPNGAHHDNFHLNKGNVENSLSTDETGLGLFKFKDVKVVSHTPHIAQEVWSFVRISNMSPHFSHHFIL